MPLNYFTFIFMLETFVQIYMHMNRDGLVLAIENKYMWSIYTWVKLFPYVHIVQVFLPFLFFFLFTEKNFVRILLCFFKTIILTFQTYFGVLKFPSIVQVPSSLHFKAKSYSSIARMSIINVYPQDNIIIIYYLKYNVT